MKAGLRSPQNFALCKRIIKKYANRFSIKLEQWTIQKDHIHMIIHGSHRSSFQHFFRVAAGQIAQEMHARGLARVSIKSPFQLGPKMLRVWRYRPFTCIVHNPSYYMTLIRYLKLNELEGLRRVAYQKNRLRDLPPGLLEELWSEEENSLRYDSEN